MVAGGIERLVVGRHARRMSGRNSRRPPAPGPWPGVPPSRGVVHRPVVHSGHRVHVVAGPGLRAPSDSQRGHFDLQQLIAVHARDVDPGASMIRLDPVRHVAGRQVGDGRHRRGVHHRDHVRPRMVAVEIGVGHERQLAVGSEADCGGEHLERRPTHERVARGVHLPQRSRTGCRGRSRCSRTVVGSDREIVRSVDISGHDAQRE